jgi:hypothetical protein
MVGVSGWAEGESYKTEACAGCKPYHKTYPAPRGKIAENGRDVCGDDIPTIAFRQYYLFALAILLAVRIDKAGRFSIQV